MSLIMPLIQKRYEDAAKLNFRHHKRSKIKLLMFYLDKHYSGVILNLKSIFFLLVLTSFSNKKYKFIFPVATTGEGIASRKVCVQCQESELHLKPSERTTISSNKVSLICRKCCSHTCKNHATVLCNNCYEEETN